MKNLACALTLICMAGYAQEKTTAIRAGTLINGTGAAPMKNAVVLVQGERIVKVGPGLAIPAGAEVIDLSARTVLPGFIDAHTHITSQNGSERTIDRASGTGADFSLVGAVNARRMLMAGFTTIRDLGSTGFADLAIKNAVERGDFPGPRMFVSLFIICATGGHGDPTNGDNAFEETLSPNGVANGADELRAKVRWLRKYGADQIKFASTGGGLSKGDNPQAQTYSDEEMKALIDEAHRLKMKVATHAHGTDGIKAAVRAGVDSVEHGIYLDEEACRLMVEHGTYFVPTLWIVDEYFDRYQIWKIPPYAHAKISAFIPYAKKSVDLAIRMHVKIALGTDAGVGEHALAAKEFAAYVRHGLTPMQSIEAGTANAAKLIGHYEDFGSVEAGKFADLVAVDGDPLEDIKILQSVKFVMKQGRVYKKD
ncbi:MAG TPA: amidohydrolase family protein [Bryobacteraceae bacterium]|nr:amidohydrolase family protein [Bryobacteraceae bacterium]